MDYPQEERAFEPRAGAVIRGGLHPVDRVKTIGGSGAMSLTETEFTALEQLKQALGMLEEKLQPILEPVPTDTADGNKMVEPNMNKISGRLMSIIEMTMSLNRRVEQLNREINL